MQLGSMMPPMYVLTQVMQVAFEQEGQTTAFLLDLLKDSIHMSHSSMASSQ